MIILFLDYKRYLFPALYCTRVYKMFPILSVQIRIERRIDFYLCSLTICILCVI